MNGGFAIETRTAPTYPPASLEAKYWPRTLLRISGAQYVRAAGTGGVSSDNLGEADEIMKDVYSQILGISTIAAVVTAAVALLLMNFSRSDRTVQESRSWLKRIIITWAVLNGLGFIMAYITPFFQGGQWTA